MKKIKKLLVVVSCVLVFKLQCLEQLSESEIVTISAESLKQEIEGGCGTFIINVLNKNSFKDCSIPGSKNVPAHQLLHYAKKQIRKGRWQADKPIVVYCASGECPLSRYAWKILKSVGFTNVLLFKGGMQDWKLKGYPVKGKARAGYLKG